MTKKRPFEPVLAYAVFLSAALHFAVLHVHFSGFAPEKNDDVCEVELSYIVVREDSASAESRDLPAAGAVNGVREAVDPQEETASGGRTKDKAYARYYDIVRAAIHSKLCSIPANGAEGAALVTFTLLPDGALSRIDETTSSPAGVQAVRGIKMAQPFPPFPDELGRLPIRFSVCVTFPAS